LNEPSHGGEAQDELSHGGEALNEPSHGGEPLNEVSHGGEVQEEVFRSQSLQSQLSNTPATLMQGGSYADAARYLPESDVLIDTTPLGMKPNDPTVISPDLLQKHHVVLDVVYGFGLTPLLAEARARGALAFDGLGMLVEQAALTIEIWACAQGKPVVVPRDLMFDVARKTLAAR
jgi:shikimate 5-dehydrogenase